jgi:cold shock protein
MKTERDSTALGVALRVLVILQRREDPVVQTGDMAHRGVVREFHVDEGWGVIDGPAVPGGCWVYFSAIAMDGFPQFAAGQPVWFRAEAADQDGFSFRAVKVWTEEAEPASPPRSKRSSGGAYQSRLILTFDGPGDLARQADSG